MEKRILMMNFITMVTPTRKDTGQKEKKKKDQGGEGDLRDALPVSDQVSTRKRSNQGEMCLARGMQTCVCQDCIEELKISATRTEGEGRTEMSCPLCRRPNPSWKKGSLQKVMTERVGILLRGERGRLTDLSFFI